MDMRRKSEMPVPTSGRPEPIRILIVSPSRARRARIVSRLGRELTCLQAESLRDALALAATHLCGVALIDPDLPGDEAGELSRELARRQPPCAPVWLIDSPTVEQMVRAMRAGAMDVVPGSASNDELRARLQACLDRIRPAVEREQHLQRLTRVCRQLNQARHEITRHVSSLCGDLVNAYQDLADQIVLLSIASEFNCLVRQELDVEGLLRTTLEYTLSKTGPTNAAVYLPGCGGDWTLGAYVNYDCAAEGAEAVLDALAAILGPRLEHQAGLTMLRGRTEIRSAFGEGAHVLGDAHVAAFSCRSDGECLAVGVLFRDRRHPFPEAVVPALRIIVELLGRQLARVVRLHHRHLPNDQWDGLGPGDCGEDDLGMAA